MKKRQVAVDPAVRLAGEIASGYRCEFCLTPTTGLGCQCSRARVFRDRWVRAADFLRRVDDNSMLSAREVAGLARSTTERAIRRLSLGDEEVTDLRHAVRDEFKAEMPWRQPRVHAETHLPV